MTLLEAMMEKCVILNKVTVGDGEGGYYTQWTEGAEITAAITHDSTMEARIAESEGVTSVFTITTGRDVILSFHDVIKRISDGRIFRVTSNGEDKKSPVIATIDASQVSAEAWELPR